MTTDTEEASGRNGVRRAIEEALRLATTPQAMLELSGLLSLHSQALHSDALTLPHPKRISDFMSERWEQLPDDAVRVHFIALCKALHRRFGTVDTLTELRAVSLYVEQVLSPEALRQIAAEINAATRAEAGAADAPE